ncbi:glycosyltransferase family 4 protein [Paenibacillus sp.]|uniref:glycosyltransferase family 4 protein n=1 Tax=Paenibacillus sp. TaxID=58172 RepID=UPI002D592DB0|nr:glycosyltransferase family 4 protein [Paenibacillus sp.]HZG84246.1 glycosyltransferase family 4 protein [Paenibacillus sp.]
MTRIAYIGTYVPQKCGIATYTHHLRQAVRGARGWKGVDPVVAVRPSADRSPLSDPAVWTLPKDDRDAYAKMAERLNRSDVDVVSLQHEFGIFDGEAGDFVLELLERLTKPVVTTFHTVFEKPEEPYRSVQERIALRSDLVLAMNRKAAEYLHEAFGTPKEKLWFVPHGTPEPAPGKRKAVRAEWGWQDRNVMMTFGLLSRGKGLETVIHALPEAARRVPNLLYAIVGQTHPEVRKREGEAYREELRALIASLGVERHVLMIDRYVEEDELVGLLSACDLYATPYPGLQQITSGTLAYAVGLGRPVLSTPYAYAKDILADHPELLLPPGDASRWAEAVISLLSDEGRRKRIARELGRIGESMHWPKVGELHLKLFGMAASRRSVTQAT